MLKCRVMLLLAFGVAVGAKRTISHEPVTCYTCTNCKENAPSEVVCREEGYVDNFGSDLYDEKEQDHLDEDNNTTFVYGNESERPETKTKGSRTRRVSLSEQEELLRQAEFEQQHDYSKLPINPPVFCVKQTNHSFEEKRCNTEADVWVSDECLGDDDVSVCHCDTPFCNGVQTSTVALSSILLLLLTVMMTSQ